MNREDRKRMVEPWLYWATFRLALAEGVGVVNAHAICCAAIRDMWMGK